MRTRIAFLFGTVLLSLWSALGMAAQLPNLPQSFIDTTYSPPTGNIINVPAGGDLQAAIDNAALGDTIVLAAGATYCCQYALPNKTTGSGWIYIRGSAYTSLPPPGTRVSPANASSMPKVSVGANDGGAIETLSGAHHYRFIGIEIKPSANAYVFNLINIGNGESSLASLPHDITFDRCYIHGDPTVGGRRGVAMNGARIAVVDSYISDFKEIGADTQAAWTYNSPGPLKIVNNYLESAGENILSGGADPSITNLVPSDIEIRGNYFFKPLAWINESWTVKNLLELKNAQRVLIEGNIFENGWASAQDGEAIVITPRNQDGDAPWSVTQDITIRLNKIINVGKALNLSGRDNPAVSQITRRVLFENNVANVTELQGASGRIIQVTNGPIDTTIRHNTAFTAGSMGFSENSPKADQFDFRDNMIAKGDFGFGGTGTNEGTPTLNGHYTNVTFLKNAIIGGSAGSYPANNSFPATTTAVGFVNFAGGNYRLAASSPFKNAASDGKDVGADIDAIEVALLGGLDPLGDNDGDGIPNIVEPSEGRNPLVKDNDIFTVARLFAMQQYRDFLGREGDSAGITFYVNALNAGTMTRPNVIEAFFNSPEFSGVSAPITRLYFATFLRIPDYPGLIFQINAFKAGTPLTVIANNFTLSPEFQSTYGSLNNTQYVMLLYQNVLSRVPSQPEIDFHVARLTSGVTRGEVLVGFSESPEYKAVIGNEVYITLMYVGMLHRSPDPAGFQFWLTYMDGGNSGLALITGFMQAPEYHNRFLP